MTEKEFIDFFSGKDEIELTPNAINNIAEKLKMSQKAKESLKYAAEMGGKWNIKRNSIVFPPEANF